MSCSEDEAFRKSSTRDKQSKRVSGEHVFHLLPSSFTSLASSSLSSSFSFTAALLYTKRWCVSLSVPCKGINEKYHHDYGCRRICAVFSSARVYCPSLAGRVNVYTQCLYIYIYTRTCMWTRWSFLIKNLTTAMMVGVYSTCTHLSIFPPSLPFYILLVVVPKRVSSIFFRGARGKDLSHLRV